MSQMQQSNEFIKRFEGKMSKMNKEGPAAAMLGTNSSLTRPVDLEQYSPQKRSSQILDSEIDFSQYRKNSQPRSARALSELDPFDMHQYNESLTSRQKSFKMTQMQQPQNQQSLRNIAIKHLNTNITDKLPFLNNQNNKLVYQYPKEYYEESPLQKKVKDFVENNILSNRQIPQSQQQQQIQQQQQSQKIFNYKQQAQSEASSPVNSKYQVKQQASQFYSPEINQKKKRNIFIQNNQQMPQRNFTIIPTKDVEDFTHEYASQFNLPTPQIRNKYSNKIPSQNSQMYQSQLNNGNQNNHNNNNNINNNNPSYQLTSSPTQKIMRANIKTPQLDYYSKGQEFQITSQTEKNQSQQYPAKNGISQRFQQYFDCQTFNNNVNNKNNQDFNNQFQEFSSGNYDYQGGVQQKSKNITYKQVQLTNGQQQQNMIQPNYTNGHQRARSDLGNIKRQSSLRDIQFNNNNNNNNDKFKQSQPNYFEKNGELVMKNMAGFYKK